jgi:hypothetical protein
MVAALVAVALVRSAAVLLARSAPNSLRRSVAPSWFNQVREPRMAPLGCDGLRRVRPRGRCARRRSGSGVVPADAAPVVESPTIRRYPLPPDPCPVRRSSSAAPASAREQGGTYVSRDRRSHRLNPRPLDPQQRQVKGRTSALIHLRWLCRWWTSVTVLAGVFGVIPAASPSFRTGTSRTRRVTRRSLGRRLAFRCRSPIPVPVATSA